ncbi:MAG: TolC family protein [Nitrospiria bacterium]
MKKLWMNLILFPLILFVMSIPALAEEESVLKLSALVEEALENNPKIAVAKAAWEAKKARIGQVNTLDDPELGFDTWNIPSDFDLDQTRNWIFFVRQKFPALGTLSLRETAARTEALHAEAAIGATVREIIAAVKIAYDDLYLAHKTIEVTEEHVEILRRFEQIAQVKVSTGAVSQQDLLKAQVTLARLENDLVTQAQQVNTVRARLNTLLKRSPRSPLARPQDLTLIPLPDGSGALEVAAFRKRPELKMAQAAILRSEQEVALAKKRFSPDFQVAVKRFQNRGIPQPNGWGISASINIPWFFHQKHDERIKETAHRVMREEALFENLKDQTRFAIEDLLVKIKTAESLATLLLKNVIPQGEQSVQLAEIGYQTDRVDFLDLLESQRQLVGFRLEYKRAVTRQNQEAARLEQVLGFDLSDFQKVQNGGLK